jgi:hypothetical protein
MLIQEQILRLKKHLDFFAENWRIFVKNAENWGELAKIGENWRVSQETAPNYNIGPRWWASPS